MVIDVGFMAGAVDQPDLLAVAAVGAAFGKEPLQIGAHGRNAGTGGHKDRIGDGILQDEVAVRAVNLDGGAYRQIGQVGQVIGEEAVLYAIDAELERLARRQKRWNRRASAACRSGPLPRQKRIGPAGRENSPRPR